MKHNLALTIVSVLSLTLLSIHLADDIVRGFAPGGLFNVGPALMTSVWLYGALILAGRRSGYVITLLGSVFGGYVALIHMMGPGMAGGRVANTGGMLLFVWTLVAISGLSSFSAILSVRGLWNGAARGNQP